MLGSNFFTFVHVEQGRGALRSDKKCQRKVLTASIVDDISGAIPLGTFGAGDLQKIRVQILCAMASNVASFFYDFSKTRTWATLMILAPTEIDGIEHECLRVVGRDEPTRGLNNILDVDNYIATKTIKLGFLHSTGKIDWEYPHLTDKPYKSVLSLPIKLNGHAIAAVNVNSSRSFHFEGRESVFQTNLSPYTLRVTSGNDVSTRRSTTWNKSLCFLISVST